MRKSSARRFWPTDCSGDGQQGGIGWGTLFSAWLRTGWDSTADEESPAGIEQPGQERTTEGREREARRGKATLAAGRARGGAAPPYSAASVP